MTAVIYIAQYESCSSVLLYRHLRS